MTRRNPEPAATRSRQRVVRTLQAFALATSIYATSAFAQPANSEYPSGPPYQTVPPAETYEFRPLGPELGNKMTGTYTVSIAGDLFFRYPVADRIGPELRDILKGADTTIGNLEGSGFALPFKRRAEDLAALGFDLLAPGEFERPDSYESDFEELAKVGIGVAGAGADLTASRRPAIQSTPKGMVAFIAACPGYNLCGDPATNAGPGPAKPGVNPVKATIWHTVTQEQFNDLKAIEASIYARRNEPDVAVPTDLAPEVPGRMKLYGQNYMVAEKPGELHYELDPADVEAQVLAVRNAKEISDFVAYHMHVHHNRYTFQQYSHDNYPPDYLQPLLHRLIDNGLDLYVGSGNHTIQGIEIYKGRPIFYNPGNLGIDVIRSADSPVNAGKLTGTESRETVLDFAMNEHTSIAYIANLVYEAGKLSEIRIYPVDLGLGKRPWSRENIPLTPTPARARDILKKIQKYSEPFGTKISIENNIGIIRVSPDATASVGQNLDIPGRRRKP